MIDIQKFQDSQIPSAICTLFEGDYHLGVAALINSLHAGGFRGVVWIGCRGERPPWLNQTTQTKHPDAYFINGLLLRFVDIDSSWHLSHYKPAFMLRILKTLHPGLERLYYFDPDIVSEAPWSFYENWADQGVALCEDGCYFRFPRTHPHRSAWRALIQAAEMRVQREIDFYVNGGFVGLRSAQCQFLIDWHELLKQIEASGIDLRAFKPGDRSDPFFGTDQDALNVALMASDPPSSVMGPDGMGFTPAGYVMQHAVDSPKPWKACYLRRLFRTGNRPSIAHKAYWQHAQGPIRPFDHRRLKHVRMGMQMAIGISRVYKR